MRNLAWVVFAIGCSSPPPKPVQPQAKPVEPVSVEGKRAEGVEGGLAGNDVGREASGMTLGRSGAGGGWESIGKGSYGTIGHGAGTGSASGRRAAVPKLAVGQAQSTGDLDKAIIRRYIKRNASKIQSCYELALAADPKLAGSVTVQFTIEGDGSVSASSGSGMKTIDACVAKVIKDITFPAPANKGLVQVSYPLTFRNEE